MLNLRLKLRLNTDINNVNPTKTLGFTLHSEDNKKWLYPQLGESRYYLSADVQNSGCIVLPIFQRRFAVIYRPRYKHRIPSGGVIYLIETDLTETKFYNHADIGDRFYLFKAFGQPEFLQNSWWIGWKGHATYPLLTYESLWGDGGNENIFVALDESNVPVAAWQESSCY